MLLILWNQSFTFHSISHTIILENSHVFSSIICTFTLKRFANIYFNTDMKLLEYIKHLIFILKRISPNLLGTIINKGNKGSYSSKSISCHHTTNIIIHTIQNVGLSLWDSIIKWSLMFFSNKIMCTWFKRHTFAKTRLRNHLQENSHIHYRLCISHVKSILILPSGYY